MITHAIRLRRKSHVVIVMQNFVPHTGLDDAKGAGLVEFSLVDEVVLALDQRLTGVAELRILQVALSFERVVVGIESSERGP